jgi:hypothetical protein
MQATRDNVTILSHILERRQEVSELSDSREPNGDHSSIELEFARPLELLEGGWHLITASR